MSLSKERKPIKKRQLNLRLTQGSSRELLYGAEIPLADAISYNIPYVKDIDTQEGFSVAFVDKSTNALNIIYGRDYTKFMQIIDSMSMNEPYGNMLYCTAVVMSCVKEPIEPMLNDTNADLKFGSRKMNIREITSELSNGITAMTKRVIPNAYDSETLRLSVRKNTVSTISEIFVNGFIGDNNEFFDNEH